LEIASPLPHLQDQLVTDLVCGETRARHEAWGAKIQKSTKTQVLAFFLVPLALWVLEKIGGFMDDLKIAAVHLLMLL
jgi:hypothetical protein